MGTYLQLNDMVIGRMGKLRLLEEMGITTTTIFS